MDKRSQLSLFVKNKFFANVTTIQTTDYVKIFRNNFLLGLKKKQSFAFRNLVRVVSSYVPMRLGIANCSM